VELVMVPGRKPVGITDIGKNSNLVDDVLGSALTRFVLDRVQPSPSHMADSRQ
jgi:hypothetical protein